MNLFRLGENGGLSPPCLNDPVRFVIIGKYYATGKKLEPQILECKKSKSGVGGD